MAGPGLFRTVGGLDIACAGQGSGTAMLGLRPERVHVAPEAAENRFEATVEFVSYLGGLIELHCRLNATDRVIAQMVNTGQTVIPHVGDRIAVGWSAQASFVFAGDATH
jgi:putative spermidine/putrescine transport system ATP-binding protein